MHRYISTGTKILIFICIIISAYLIFTSDSVKEHIGGLGQTNSYISFFFAGILFALGFTLPISAGLLLSLNGNNLMLSVLLGGAGSVIGDLIIIAIAKKAFAKEFIKIEASREYHRWKKKINKLFGREIGPHTFTYIFGAAVIASPLPDEIGLSFLSGLPDFKLAPFAIISFILHSAGIFVLLYAESQLF